MSAEIYLANNLQFLRKDAGLSQQALADELDITRSKIASYENGKAEPNVAILTALSHYFNISLNYLLEKDLQSIPNFKRIAAARVNDQEVLNKIWSVRLQKIESFEKKYEQIQLIQQGLEALNKLKAQNNKDQNSDCEGIKRDLDNTMDVLENTIDLSREMLQYLKRLGDNRIVI